jgi:hypothetical protein
VDGPRCAASCCPVAATADRRAATRSAA